MTGSYQAGFEWQIGSLSDWIGLANLYYYLIRKRLQSMWNMHALQLRIQHMQVTPVYLCNTIICFILPIASMPSHEYFCDCPIYYKQRKKVSKTTYFDYAKYWNRLPENYHNFLAARGVILPPPATQQLEQDIDTHQGNQVLVGAFWDEYLMDIDDNSSEQSVQVKNWCASSYFMFASANYLFLEYFRWCHWHRHSCWWICWRYSMSLVNSNHLY